MTLAEKTTWVKIDRNILNWEWYTDSNTKALFLHFILKANIKTGRFKGVTVNRGQLITSYDHLSKELSMSVRSIRTSLNHLKSTGEVTSQSYHDFTLITVVNYDKFQDIPTSQVTSKRQAIDKPATSNRQQSKNNKEYKKRKNIVADAPKDGEVRDWEIECKVPEQFVGRFYDKKAWLDFLGVDEDGIPIRFG